MRVKDPYSIQLEIKKKRIENQAGLRGCASMAYFTGSKVTTSAAAVVAIFVGANWIPA
jgi:hypothetical protein